FPCGRSAATFAAFVFPDLHGSVVVHYRYRSYDSFPGLLRQLCCQQVVHDVADSAETYPDAHWPVQIREALQRLIPAANTARAAGLAAVPADVAAPPIKAFRHGVMLGLGRRSGGFSRTRASTPRHSGPDRPGGRSWKLRPIRSLPWTSSTSTLFSCAA